MPQSLPNQIRIILSLQARLHFDKLDLKKHFTRLTEAAIDGA
jgi:hypothetical protein